MTLACRDLGFDCSFVASGENLDEVIEEGIKHGKETHGYSEEQLRAPEMIKKVKAAIKEE